MADDRTPTPRDRPASGDHGDVAPVLLDISKLTPDERRTVTQQVRTLERSPEVQCPECGRTVLRQLLRTHLPECLPGVIRTTRLEVLGPDGTVQTVLGELDGEEAGLAFRDPLGRDRLTLTHGDFGAALAWHLNGVQVIVLQAETGSGEDAEPGVSFMLAGFDGAPVAGWRVRPTGSVVPIHRDDDVSPEELDRMMEETRIKFAPLLEKLREDEDAWNRTTDTGGGELSEEEQKELRAMLRRTSEKFLKDAIAAYVDEAGEHEG